MFMCGIVEHDQVYRWDVTVPSTASVRFRPILIRLEPTGTRRDPNNHHLAGGQFHEKTG